MFLTPLFNLMAEKQGSDLFFSAGAPICIKIRGSVMPINNHVLDAGMVRKIAYEIMTEQQIAAYETGLEMNFSYGVAGIGSFRVNVFRQRGAVGMVIRYIRSDIPGFDDLRLPPLLADLVLEKRGLVLIVGSTGSGKSSTLAAMLDHRNQTCTGHILTIEDPIEFNFRHRKSIVNQREVGMDTLSYENALVNAMREAPDVLMIGEIRDRPTLQHAIIYAQTGHLCLSTLHANNSYHALNRIFSMFPPEARAGLLMDLSVTLRAIVSQRLLRAKDGRLVPAFEVLLNTTNIQDLIRKGEVDQIKEAMEQSLSPGSMTFEQSLLKLYLSGTVTMEEALANSDSPTNFSWLVNNATGAPGIGGVSAPPPRPAPASAPPSPAAPAAGTPKPVADLASFTFNLDVV